MATTNTITTAIEITLTKTPATRFTCDHSSFRSGTAMSLNYNL